MSAKHSIDESRLTIIGERHNGKGWVYKCRCTCGSVREYLRGNIVGGLSLSCGCLQRQRTSEANKKRFTHGHTRAGNLSAAYRCWSAIRRRCGYKKGEHYARYGGRGIRVCERWMKFENFFADMGEPPPGMTIERKNNDGPYSKGNCRWATAKEQARNRSNNRMVTFRGVAKCLSEWAAEMGLRVDTVWGRLARGWSVEKALTTPARKMRK
jgi:hypothetical protein